MLCQISQTRLTSTHQGSSKPTSSDQLQSGSLAWSTHALALKMAAQTKGTATTSTGYYKAPKTHITFVLQTQARKCPTSWRIADQFFKQAKPYSHKPSPQWCTAAKPLCSPPHNEKGRNYAVCVLVIYKVQQWREGLAKRSWHSSPQQQETLSHSNCVVCTFQQSPWMIESWK